MNKVERIEYPSADKFRPETSENPFSHVPKPQNLDKQQVAVGSAALMFGIGADIHDASEHEMFRIDPRKYLQTSSNFHEFSHPENNIPTSPAADTAPSAIFSDN
jgi:hypothetical protein